MKTRTHFGGKALSFFVAVVLLALYAEKRTVAQDGWAVDSSFHFLDSSNPHPPCLADALGDPGNVAVLDVNGDSRFNIADPAFLAHFLLMGSPPAAPGPACINISTALGCPDNPGCQ